MCSVPEHYTPPVHWTLWSSLVSMVIWLLLCRTMIDLLRNCPWSLTLERCELALSFTRLGGRVHWQKGISIRKMSSAQLSIKISVRLKDSYMATLVLYFRAYVQTYHGNGLCVNVLLYYLNTFQTIKLFGLSTERIYQSAINVTCCRGTEICLCHIVPH